MYVIIIIIVYYVMSCVIIYTSIQSELLRLSKRVKHIVIILHRYSFELIMKQIIISLKVVGEFLHCVHQKLVLNYHFVLDNDYSRLVP